MLKTGHLLIILSGLVIISCQTNVDKGSIGSKIYFSEESGIYLLLEKDSFAIITNPYQTIKKVHYRKVRNTFFFGNDNSGIISDDKVIIDQNLDFEQLTEKQSNYFKTHLKLSSNIHDDITSLLETTYSDYIDFSVGNISITSENNRIFDFLLIHAICRYRDEQGIDRGFDSRMNCSINGEDYKITFIDQ